MFPLRSCALLTRRHVLCRSREVESVFTGGSQIGSTAPNNKESMKKDKTPQGRFDRSEETSQDALEKFTDDVNPVTKEKGGPRGPEPTRYGDWERKGRCVDF